MSDSFIELAQFNQDKSEKFLNFYKNNSLELSDISSIKKSKFSQNYHFLCKFCQKIPKVRFIQNNKINFFCECEKSPREINITKIFELLFNSLEDDIDINEILKCYMHKDEKYILYCKKCNKNLCFKCVNEFIDEHGEHNQDLISFAFDKKTINEIKYIIQKFEEKENFCINNDSNIELDNETDENINEMILIPVKNKNKLDEFDIDDSKNIINDISEEKNYFILKNRKNNFYYNEEEKAQIITMVDQNNNEELFDEEYFFTNLLLVVIDDYKNYPNFSYIETISNAEKFICLYFKDYNEINLKYVFDEKNIENDSLKLFGKKFIDNNKENFFLIINEKIMDLNKNISLSDIYDNNISKIEFPLKLDVKLIEKKYKMINDLSFMFNGISNLDSSSELNTLNTNNVIKMNYMFYNCTSIKNYLT